MAFSLKNWKNRGESPNTPLTATSLRDLEKRVTDYGDTSPIVTASGSRLRALRDFVSVVDFGAIADYNGTTGTDNTTAIQTALNSGARHVFVPSGDFLTGPLTIPTEVGFFGNGQNLTRLWAKSGTTISLISSAATTAQFISVEAMTLIGVGQTSGATNQHGIYFQGVAANEYPTVTYAQIPDAHHTLRDLAILGMGGQGLFLDTQIRSSQIDNVWVDSPGQSGFNIFGTDNNIVHCIASTVTDGTNLAGFVVAGPNCRYVGCKAFYCGTLAGNKTDGFRIVSDRMELSACEAQDNGRYGFNFAANVTTGSALAADSNGVGGFNINGTGIVLSSFQAYSRSGGRYTQNQGVNIGGSASKCVLRGNASGNNTDVNGTFKGHSVSIQTTAGLTTNEVAIQATTGTAGYVQTNGTGTVVSYTAPSDGKLHTVNLFGSVIITSTQTGGIISMTWTLGGNSHTTQIDGGAHSAGTVPIATATALIDPGTTVSVTQSSALTVGAATVYATLASAAE